MGCVCGRGVGVGGDANLLLGKIIAENCIKMRYWTGGAGSVSSAPRGSANDLFILDQLA